MQYYIVSGYLCHIRRFPVFQSAHLFILVIKDIPLIGIDDVCVLIFIAAFMLRPVSHMYMTVDEKFRPVFFNQIQKCLEALMGQIAAVIELVGGSVGDQYIESAPPEQLKSQPGDPLPHFFFRILMSSVAVAHGPSQTKDTDAFIDKDLVIDAGTALRRYLLVFVIVVAVYIENRR